MSSLRSRRVALAAAAFSTLTVGALAAAPAASVTAAPLTAHLSEPDALWLPNATTVPELVASPPKMALISTVSNAYRFSSVLDGQPVRWNPCSAIHWRSNTARGPAGGLDVLKGSVARIAALTGTSWVYDGASATNPTSGYLPTTPQNSNRPVLLGWTDGASSDLLAGKPAQVLGMTRTVWFGTNDGQGHQLAATRGAVIALDRTNRLPLRGPTSWSATSLHELGHVMGLDHPYDPRELMAATLPAAVSDMQMGDRTGLTRVGRAAGCVIVPGM